MVEDVTKQDLNKLEKSIDKKIERAVEDISSVIKDFAFQVDERFNKLEEKIADLKKNLNSLIATIDGFIKRLDEMETDNVARDAQVARIERWVEQIAKKTGVKLEY